MSIHKKVYSAIQQQLREQQEELEVIAQDLKKSLDEEGKSSAGDKHNTSRAMIHLEQEKIANQFQLIKNQIQQLNQMKEVSTKNASIGFGNLVKTTNYYFLLGISLGKINVEEIQVFCISMDSPVGRQFLGKKVSEKILFMQKEEEILQVLPE